MGDAVYIRVTLQRGESIGYEGEIQLGLHGETAARTTYRLPLRQSDLPALDLNRPDVYGLILWKLLFGAPEAEQALLRGVEQAWNSEQPLRLQLHIQESARELTHLAWELLRVPNPPTVPAAAAQPERSARGWLARSRGILFSRYLPLHPLPRPQALGGLGDVSSGGSAAAGSAYSAFYGSPAFSGSAAQSQPAPAHAALREPALSVPGHTPLALAAVSCPAANRFDLPALDAPRELEAAGAAIPGAVVDSLAACPGQPVTLERLVARLRQGAASGQPYDVLYLACYTHPNHGFPGLALLFEPQAGRDALIQAGDLAQHLAGLPPRARPRLLVLAACDLPADGDGAAPGVRARPGELRSHDHVEFGHILVQSGIPAVLTLPDPARCPAAAADAASQLLPVFFTELFKHGQPDRALASARRAVDGEDWWRPVLYAHGPSLPL